MLPCGLILKIRGIWLYISFTTLLFALNNTFSENQNINNSEYIYRIFNFTINLKSVIIYIFLILSVIYITYCIIAIFKRLQDLILLVLGRNKLFVILNLDLISNFKNNLEKNSKFKHNPISIDKKIRYALLGLKFTYFIFNLYLTYILLRVLIIAVTISNKFCNLNIPLEYLSFDWIATYFFFIIFVIILYRAICSEATLVKFLGQDKLYSHKISIVKAFLSSEQKSLVSSKKNLSLSILKLILKVIVIFFLLIGYCLFIGWISNEISSYGLVLGLLTPIIKQELTPLFFLPEENININRSLITTNDYKLGISQNDECHLNPIGTSSSFIDKYAPANGQHKKILENFLAENLGKEKKLARELEKSLKVLVKSNLELDGKDFMVKNKISLNTIYDLNFKIFTKGYLIPDILKSYSINEVVLLSYYKPILENLNVNMDKHPLLNANWVLSSNLLGSPADIIRIPKELHNSYKPYVFSYNIENLRDFHKLIIDKNLVKLTENSFWRTETHPLKLSWSESSLNFNYNININLDNVQYVHKLAISHLFPSLKIVSSLKNNEFTELYTGPLSSYFHPSHFFLTDNEGSVALARIILPSEFNSGLPNSLCYTREKLVPKLSLNLREGDWLFDQSSSVLEYFSPEGYIINIKLDKNLLSVLGFRKYLIDAFFPAITEIHTPFSKIVGSQNSLSEGSFPKVQLLGEDGLQLFSKELFSIDLKKFNLISLIKQLNQEIDKGLLPSITVACLNSYLSDYPLNTLFEIDYERLNLQDFLIKKSLIVFKNNLYIFLSKSNLPEDLNLTLLKSILIPLDSSHNHSEAENSESKLYLKKIIKNYINKNNLSKDQLESLNKIIKKKLS